MRIKVELHREVIWFIRHEAGVTEVRAFYEQLWKVSTDPISLIEHSEAAHQPEKSRYMLRFFRFERCIAIFETNRARDRIRVRECRRLLPRDEGKQKPNVHP